jgi:hypothetical protein
MHYSNCPKCRFYQRISSKGKPIDTKSPLVWCVVGGRLKNSKEAFDTKHQIVLPKHHHVTKVLVRSIHEQHGHVGQEALLALVRQSYWPVGTKDIVRNVTRSCIRSFKSKTKINRAVHG